MTFSFDLAIAGGGPAGTAAAITAARAGLRVLLCESGKLPRHRVCGEFVSHESLAVLRVLLGETAFIQLSSKAPRIELGRIFLDDRQFRLLLPSPALSISRADLDLALWNVALAAGVDVRQSETVTGIDGSGPFMLHASDEFVSRFAIDATGRWSRLREQSTPSGPKTLGLKAHFRESSPPLSTDLYFFPGGYCGVQPVSPDTVNVAAVVRADSAGNLDQVLKAHPELQARSSGWQPLFDVPLAAAPLIFSQPRPLGGSILRAGDAAGFIDPFVGDGISLALHTGVVAAKSVIASATAAAAATLYEREYRARFASAYRKAAWLRVFFSMPRQLRRPLLAGARPALLRYLFRATRSH